MTPSIDARLGSIVGQTGLTPFRAVEIQGRVRGDDERAIRSDFATAHARAEVVNEQRSGTGALADGDIGQHLPSRHDKERGGPGVVA